MGLEQPSFVAHATHPSFGEEAVDGRITIDQWHFYFRCENLDVKIPLPRLEIAPGDAESGGIFFSDVEQPDWSVYTYDDRILRNFHLTKNACTRVQLNAFRSRGELKSRLKITGWVLGGFVAIALVINLFTSLAVRMLVAKIPPRFEQDLGAQFLAEVKQEEKFIQDAKKQALVDKAAAPLLAVLPTNRLHFQFFIAEDEEPNAFSIPGGYVIITTGLLDLLDKPEQLTAVLAHEIAHVTEKHMFRQVISSFGPMMLMELVLAGNSRSAGAIGAASSLLIVQGFSQEYEFEADNVGWNYLLAARVNPHGMIEMLSKLETYEDAQKDDEFAPRAFRSHPATAKRIRHLASKWKRLKDKSHFVDFNADTAESLNR